MAKAIKALESLTEHRFYMELVGWAIKNDILIDVIKLNITGRKGWPDRMILVDGGFTIFVEFKRPGEEPRKLQHHVHARLRKMGFIILVHDNLQEALTDVKALILPPPAAN